MRLWHSMVFSMQFWISAPRPDPKTAPRVVHPLRHGAWLSRVRASLNLSAMLAWTLTGVLALTFALVHLTAHAADTSEGSTAVKPPVFGLVWDADTLHATVQTHWQPTPAIQMALERGVPLVFELRATVKQVRWYWFDKTVVEVFRRTRVSYLPLTGNWRVGLTTDDDEKSPIDTYALQQSVTSLSQAIALATGVTRWPLAQRSDLSPESPTVATVDFRLDRASLPRPFQIGITEDTDWSSTVVLTAPVPSPLVEQPKVAQPKPAVPRPAASPAPDTVTAAPVVTAEELNRLGRQRQPAPVMGDSTPNGVRKP